MTPSIHARTFLHDHALLHLLESLSSPGARTSARGSHGYYQKGEVMMNDPDIIRWLESPEGEDWSSNRHKPQVNSLVVIKYDTSDRWGNIYYHHSAIWTTFYPHGVVDAPV